MIVMWTGCEMLMLSDMSFVRQQDYMEGCSTAKIRAHHILDEILFLKM